MHAAAQKIARALISHSPFHRCARKISRFARNDDAGKALLSFSACLRRISPLSFIPPVPYPPLRGTFPSRGRLWVWGSGILIFHLLETHSPLAFIPPVPYPPLWGTFPSRGRLFMTNGEAPLHFSFERTSNGNHGLRRPWFPTISSPNMRPLSPLRPCRGRS